MKFSYEKITKPPNGDLMPVLGIFIDLEIIKYLENRADISVAYSTGTHSLYFMAFSGRGYYKVTKSV